MNNKYFKNKFCSDMPNQANEFCSDMPNQANEIPEDKRVRCLLWQDISLLTKIFPEACTGLVMIILYNGKR